MSGPNERFYVETLPYYLAKAGFVPVYGMTDLMVAAHPDEQYVRQDIPLTYRNDSEILVVYDGAGFPWVSGDGDVPEFVRRICHFDGGVRVPHIENLAILVHFGS